MSVKSTLLPKELKSFLSPKKTQIKYFLKICRPKAAYSLLLFKSSAFLQIFFWRKSLF